MDNQEKERESLERILNNSSADPAMLSCAFLRTITNDFSEEIGRGGFGVVYMGILQNAKVAVKKLSRTDEFSEKQFEDELLLLIRAKHKNIARFLGYCSDTQRQVLCYEGKHIIADVRQRYLCFEYAPNKSLHDYLKDNSHICEWSTCYQLIVEICQGLHYLHNEARINHLDLKPENILLDAEMVPKITDFGLSRRFSGSQSRIITTNILGSLGYMPPEFLNNGEISFKTDIFALGIIIKKLLRETNDCSDFENWHQSVHMDFPQVKKCIEIAQLCVDEDQHRRPTIDYIFDMLNVKETVIQKVSGVFCQAVQAGNESGSSVEQPSRDRSTKIDSNPTSNMVGPSMVNEEICPRIPQLQGIILYMHQNIVGPNHNQVNIADPKQPQMFGYTNVHDYPIYDSIGSSAKIVARAQGLHTETSMNSDDWFHWSSIVFSDERFPKSSLKAIGNQNKIKGEWAIVGGTGVFTFALGTISICRIQDNGSSNMKEIQINAFSRIPQTTPTEAMPFMDMPIMVGSNATSNAASTSMGNQQIIGPVTQQSQGAEHNIILYMHQTIHGPNRNQVNIVDPKQPQMFGYTNAHDYPIYDSLGPSAKIVARAQGLHTETSMNSDDWFHWSSIVFTDESFQQSSIKAIGNQNKVEGEWAIVGGTGVFTSAQGTISIYRIQGDSSSNIKEVRIIAFCRSPSQTTPTKRKPFKDRSITVYSNAYPSRELEYDLIFYMHQTIDGPSHNQVNIADPKQPLMFGCTNVHDYPIYDSLRPGARTVARAQGLHTETDMNNDDWFHWSSIVFHNERFGGSSFKAIGNQNKVEGEWAIIGGTGVFTCAQGTISIYRIQEDSFSNIKEIRIRAFLLHTTDHSN